MTNQTTINKLIEMRLTALADAFRNQTNDPKMKDIPFDDRLGMLVDIEYTSRKNNRLRRLIRKAEFEQPLILLFQFRNPAVLFFKEAKQFCCRNFLCFHKMIVSEKPHDFKLSSTFRCNISACFWSAFSIRTAARKSPYEKASFPTWRCQSDRTVPSHQEPWCRILLPPASGTGPVPDA